VIGWHSFEGLEYDPLILCATAVSHCEFFRSTIGFVSIANQLICMTVTWSPSDHHGKQVVIVRDILVHSDNGVR
jgi:hypothetical protein